MVHSQPTVILVEEEDIDTPIPVDNEDKKALPFPLEEEVDADATTISDSLKLICALSIPEGLCPSTHSEFLKVYNEENKIAKKSSVDSIHKLADNKLRVKIKPKISKKRRGRFKRRKPSIIKKEVLKMGKESEQKVPEEPTVPLPPLETVVDDGRIPCCSKSLLEPSISLTTEPPAKTDTIPIVLKESLAKPKAKNTKRWFEDEKPVVSIVGPNELMVNGKLVIVDYSNFTKEVDVEIQHELLDDLKPPALPGISRPCKKDFCRLGCICKSIAENEIVRSRCQNVKCMFGCVCFPSSNVIDNDGDIRSRLRPRVSLLNWKHSDNTEKDTMANYKQLERGMISLRAKRTAQPPPRLRNEYVLDGVRNPLQPLPERNIRKRIRHKVPYYSLIASKGNKKPSEQLKQQLKNVKEENKCIGDPRPTLKPKGSFSEEPISQILNNGQNGSDFSIPRQEVSSLDMDDDCQIIYEEEVPTILYQKIGTTPDIQNDEFLKSSTNAITSYWSVKKMLKSLPPREQVRRHDGRMVYVSWTATKSTPKVIPRQVNPDKSVTGDHVILPLLPENSEWLMYEFPKHYEKSSCISFTDIGLIIFTKVLIFQKIKADINNKVVKLKLKHHERKEAMSTISLYLLPRVGNLVVLGPMKKDICKSTKVTFPQTLSYIRHIHRKNFFGSSHFWDQSYSMHKETLSEPFDRYIQRKKLEDESVLTGKIVDPEVMEQIIPELMETYEPDEVPGPFRPTPSLRKNNVMQLKWSDSMKCSANFHPRVEPVRYAVPLRRLGCEVDDIVGTSPSESEEEDDLESVQEAHHHFSDDSSVITID